MVNAFRWMVLVIGLAAIIGSIMVTSAGDGIIIIKSPSDSETVNTKIITVSGDATGYLGAVIKSVTVKGYPAEGTAPEGGFSSWEKKNISLQKGLNVIPVVATDFLGNKTRKNRTVYYITPPSAPQKLQLTAGDGFVSLSWSAPSDVGGSALMEYRIYQGAYSGGGSYLASVSASTTTYNDTTVTNGQTYNYTITTVNVAGESSPSNEVPAKPQGPPGPPRNIEAAASDDHINLEWFAPSDDGGSEITNYNIYRGTTSGGETPLKTVGNVLNYTDYDVTNDRRYYYQVSAVNSVSEGEKSNEVDAKLISLPTPTPPTTPIGTSTFTSIPTSKPTSAPTTPTPTESSTPMPTESSTPPPTPTEGPTSTSGFLGQIIAAIIVAMATIMAVLLAHHLSKKVK